MALKDWKRDWNIGGEYPEWNKGDKKLTIYEGDTSDKFSVAILKEKSNDIKYLIKNVSEKEALKIAKDYMKSN